MNLQKYSGSETAGARALRQEHPCCSREGKEVRVAEVGERGLEGRDFGYQAKE